MLKRLPSHLSLVILSSSIQLTFHQLEFQITKHKAHSSSWDDCFIEIMLRCHYTKTTIVYIAKCSIFMKSPWTHGTRMLCKMKNKISNWPLQTPTYGLNDSSVFSLFDEVHRTQMSASTELRAERRTVHPVERA